MKIMKFNESWGLPSDDIKGLREIKQTLELILKDKFDNDNNVIEEQITWLDKLIKRLIH